MIGADRSVEILVPSDRALHASGGSAAWPQTTTERRHLGASVEGDSTSVQVTRGVCEVRGKRGQGRGETQLAGTKCRTQKMSRSPTRAPATDAAFRATSPRTVRSRGYAPSVAWPVTSKSSAARSSLPARRRCWPNTRRCATGVATRDTLPESVQGTPSAVACAGRITGRVNARRKTTPWRA